MANWKQIQGRIRRARASADPVAALGDLYQKTQDAMVAFDLAKLCEKDGKTEDAVKWYQAAHGRFRRAEWKKKAAEALAKLGVEVPVPSEPVFETRAAGEAWQAQKLEAATRGEGGENAGVAEAGWADGVEAASVKEAGPAEEIAAAPVAVGSAPIPGRAVERRTRGRRGGRGRGGRGQGGRLVTSARRGVETPQQELEIPGLPRVPKQIELPQTRVEEPAEEAEGLHVSAGTVPGSWQVPTRGGDPGLASRVARLDMQLRRLMASPLYKLDVADQAPAGPGVYVLLDSDQTTYYYIEPCKTIRAALGQLLRSGRTTVHREGSFRADMAEHLGIVESKVSKYVKDNCLVRWLQLDEGAGALAHFAIAVLRPALNNEQ